MKQEQGDTAPMAAVDDAKGRIDRRRFMASTAGIGAIATLGGGALDQALAQMKAGAGDETSALLPDGSQFPRWEQPLTFSKTYYVNNTAPNADDNGPGDSARPFRTIGKAAEVLQPGERVVIAAGVYRECVRPARGGTGPSQMISYEAAPGAKVRILGSEVLRDGWRQETVPTGPPGPPPAGGARPGLTVWRRDLTPDLFPDGYNPFALISIMPSWSWLDTKIVDIGPYLRRRGLVFVDGKPLEPVEQIRELATDLPSIPDFTKPAVSVNGQPPRRRGGPIMQEIGGVPTARFAVEQSGRAIIVRLASGTPADHQIEVTTRQHVFIPVRSGIGYIRLKGLSFEHCGNVFPYPQSGMVSPSGGDHWIVEDNTFEWANGMAIELGSGAYSAGAPRSGAGQIVRRNTFRYCGIEGIGGMGTSDTVIEDNLIEWCGWADAERGWEAAGAKFHRAKNMLFRRNVIRHMRYANAAWWDVDNVNCRITQNVFADVLTVGAAIHIEMTPGPSQNAIDNNIIWDVRNAEPGTPGQRGCAGSGIFDNASDNLIIAHNIIGRCDNAGIFAIVRPDRGGGVGKGLNVANNIFAKCKAGIVFLNKDNKADGNVYIGMPEQFQGLFDGVTTKDYDPEAWRKIKYHALPAWRDAFGWDKTSVAAEADISFDPDQLQLTFTTAKALPRVVAVERIGNDIFGKPKSAARVAGPLGNLGPKTSMRVDPRVLS